MTSYQVPDLASVLQTLAAYAPPNPHPPQPPELEEGEYDPSTFQPLTAAIHRPPSPPHISPEPPPHINQEPPQSPLPQPPLPQPQPPTQQRPPLASASTITTYPSALRHTTTLLSTSPPIRSRLRHLIKAAHEHESQWWTGRQALFRTLSTRDASRRKLADVLASIGGGGGGGTPSTTDNGEKKSMRKEDEGGDVEEAKVEEEQEKELKEYDRKVHKAYTEMRAATYAELKRMGIPFFCIDEERFVGEGEGKLGREELEKLKGKMVVFLEDMVAE
ncbi:MAG: hypothetical protein Q9220_001096 [cf. Caloplaca sp. 1 TL-2023]